VCLQEGHDEEAFGGEEGAGDGDIYEYLHLPIKK